MNWYRQAQWYGDPAEQDDFEVDRNDAWYEAQQEEREHEAFQVGQRDWGVGAEPSDNPYSSDHDPDLFDSWSEGWNAADKQRRNKLDMAYKKGQKDAYTGARINQNPYSSDGDEELINQWLAGYNAFMQQQAADAEKLDSHGYYDDERGPRQGWDVEEGGWGY